jgi:hypothetical protein
MFKEAVISWFTVPSQDYHKVTQRLDVVGFRVEIRTRGYPNIVLDYNPLYRHFRCEDVNWSELTDDEA